jgi:hypothetical protein
LEERVSLFLISVLAASVQGDIFGDLRQEQSSNATVLLQDRKLMALASQAEMHQPHQRCRVRSITMFGMTPALAQ